MQVYREDLIERVLELLRFYLLSNVLAFHDARLCQAHRPQLLDDAGEGRIIAHTWTGTARAYMLACMHGRYPSGAYWRQKTCATETYV